MSTEEKTTALLRESGSTKKRHHVTPHVMNVVLLW